MLEELWSGHKISYDRLHNFGYEAYAAHVPKELHAKLDLKSQKCIFIGYPDGTKAWRFWDPVLAAVGLRMHTIA